MNKKANIPKGALGEKLAAIYLEQHGFRLICQNYRKKWGEIDIIATKEKEIHFVEVKATVCKSLKNVARLRAKSYLPEERVDSHKQKQLRRIIETFLMEFPAWGSGKVVVDVAAVYLAEMERRGRVFLIENIMLE